MHVRLRNPDRVEVIDGQMTVEQLLDQLDVNPTTVLVISGGQLVTAGHTLGPDADVEIRPVISGGAGPVRCIECRAPAVIEEPRHRSSWCAAHFVDHVHRQIRKAVDHGNGGSEHPVEGVSRGRRMFSYSDKILVAVSGGKDSLALWDALLTMGYQADGLYIGLGIGGYSDRSGAMCKDFAESRGVKLHLVDLQNEYGYTTPSGSRATERAACGVCGLSKRYIFNRVAVDHGYDVMLTGHNLDDEAATLMNNVLHWQQEFLVRQRPLLPSTGANQVRKAKPLYRLSEREMAAYCVIRGIDYIVEECPLVAGNTGTANKDILSDLEQKQPGAKANFLFGFLEKIAPQLGDDGTAESDVQLHECDQCGMPTTGSVCAFCRQQRRILPILASNGNPS
ncbi:MAG: hypothetical protein ACI867_001100 [Glaciecola sp.]|jgi:uncharacterized protein (TIGR00269 family)